MSTERHDATGEETDETRARVGEGEAPSEEAEAAGQQQTPPPEPNIKLRRTGEVEEPTGEKVPVDPEKPELGERDVMRKVPTYAKPAAPGKLNIGMTAPIIMPSVEQQRSGWFEPRAAEIIQTFPDRYIRVQPKGGN